MTGRIHSFQTLGAVDGPGLRVVVFMQGCPLRCRYCHNPDTWGTAGGEAYAVEDVVARVRRYVPYFGTGGGVTVSGGEPLLQAAFVHALFTRLREEGIHTCLDTAGVVLNDDVRALLAKTDLCLLDIKAADDAGYRALCGVGIQTPLAFLSALEQRGVPTWVRHVVVPGLNDKEEHIAALRALVAPYACVERIELLGFETLCVEKYQRLGIPFALGDTPPMDHEALSRLQSLL